MLLLQKTAFPANESECLAYFGFFLAVIRELFGTESGFKRV